MENTLESASEKASKYPYLQLLLITALILGVLASLPEYINWAFGKPIITGFLSMLYLIIVTLGVLITQGKKAMQIQDPTRQNGYTFMQGWGFSILSATLSGVVIALLGMLLINVIDPTILTSRINEATAMLEQTYGDKQEYIDTALSMVKFTVSPIGSLLINLFSMAIWGGLVGLVAAALLKKEPQI